MPLGMMPGMNYEEERSLSRKVTVSCSTAMGW